MQLDVRNQSICNKHICPCLAWCIDMDVLSLRLNTWLQIFRKVTKFSIDSHVVCGKFKGLGFKSPNSNPFHTIQVPIWSVGFLLQLVSASEWSWVTIILLHFAITRLEAWTIERNCQMFWYLSNYLFCWWIQSVAILM